MNRRVTHSGDLRLARHLANAANAAVKEDARGTRRGIRSGLSAVLNGYLHV